MRARFLPLLLAVLSAAAIAWPGNAFAQAQTPKWVEPPDKLPNVQGADPTRNLDFLFGALKVAPDDESAKAIESRIWALWVISESDTANLLMTRVKTAVDGKETELALKLLDSIIKIRPDYTEAWNRRATLRFMNKEFGKSLADIREVLRREPRHFGALSGLGQIMQQLGDDRRALEIYRRALEVHPRLERLPDLVKTLQEKVEGQDI